MRPYINAAIIVRDVAMLDVTRIRKSGKIWLTLWQRRAHVTNVPDSKLNRRANVADRSLVR